MTIWTGEIKVFEQWLAALNSTLPELEGELERLVNADDDNMVFIYSRRCLEVIISDLCEKELGRPRKTDPLQGCKR